jgi:regulation of enolase protein 1 (concanavalin A-like superfamily)
MPQHDPVTIATLPHPLRWHGNPQQWQLSPDSTLTITAGQQTDWFIDPDTGTVKSNAPALLMGVDAPCMLAAQVSANHTATYDAAVLAVYQSSQVWAKLCLELSPQGQVMVVSVVTRGVSDDCNAIPVAGSQAYLRLAKLDRAYAFHYSPDGRRWQMIRYFSLGDDPHAEIGFLAQSPTGENCTAVFSAVAYRSEKLMDIRSGD